MATTRSTGYGVTAAVWNSLFTNLSDAGAWQGFASVAQTFSAGDYTASGSMTWTVASGDVGHNRYTVMGKTILWRVGVANTTVGGTPSTELRIALPNSYTASTASVAATALIDENGTPTTGYVLINTSGTYAQIYKTSGGNWTATTDQTDIYFQILFEIA